MEEPYVSLELPNVDFEECASNVIPINDDNYRAAIDWFKACFQLSQNLPVANRDYYELKVIANVKSSLSDFFQRTELALSTLVGLEREVTDMFQGLGPPIAQYKLSPDSSLTDDADCDPSDTCTDSDDDVCDAFSQLYKRFLWVAIASIILLVLLMIVLATMCWLRNYIERDMKEIFVACPKEELGDSASLATGEPSVNTMRSVLSRRKGTGRRRKSHSMDHPEEEDEELVALYGNQEPNAYAYPVRVWMTPLGRKRQPEQKGKCIIKRAGTDATKVNNK